MKDFRDQRLVGRAIPCLYGIGKQKLHEALVVNIPSMYSGICRRYIVRIYSAECIHRVSVGALTT